MGRGQNQIRLLGQHGFDIDFPHDAHDLGVRKLMGIQVVSNVLRYVIAATGGDGPYRRHARRQRGIQRAFIQRDDTHRVISNLHVAVGRLQRARLGGAHQQAAHQHSQ